MSLDDLTSVSRRRKGMGHDRVGEGGDSEGLSRGGKEAENRRTGTFPSFHGVDRSEPRLRDRVHPQDHGVISRVKRERGVAFFLPPFTFFYLLSPSCLRRERTGSRNSSSLWRCDRCQSCFSSLESSFGTWFRTGFGRGAAAGSEYFGKVSEWSPSPFRFESSPVNVRPVFSFSF